MTAAPAHVDEADRAAHVHALLQGGDDDTLRAYLSGLPHASDVAVLLEELDEDERARVVQLLAHDPALVAEALAEMEWEEHPEETLAALEPDQIAAVVAELSDDDAADMIGELDPEDRDRVLAALPTADAGEIRDLLRYDEESAGGLMTTELVVVPAGLSAAEAIDEVRRQARDVGDFYSVFVVDDHGRLQGTVPLQALVTSAADAPLSGVVEPPVATVGPDTDQEEVGRILSKYNLTAVPVVDTWGHLMGAVTFDDVIDVIEAETTEDILKLGGVSEGEEIRGDWADAVRSRLPWLCVNLVTASAGAAVVLHFEPTIERLTFLAVLMPVVAGLGGNSGTQALTVTVRRLALSSDARSRRAEIVRKEFLVGLGNGLAIGAIVASLAWILRGDPKLGLVVMCAMWINLTVGSFAGAFVPIVLERLKADPAVASSIFVTAFTDLFGFFLLLGLATYFLL
jgi:magnesium transporter